MTEREQFEAALPYHYNGILNAKFYTGAQMIDYARAAVLADRAARAAAPDALENCRLYAARHRKEEWAQTILRFCNEAGVTGSPLRAASPAEPCPSCGNKTVPATYCPSCYQWHRGDAPAAAPAEPQQPVAWMTEDGRVANAETKRGPMASSSKAAFCIPLYATPVRDSAWVAEAMKLHADAVNVFDRDGYNESYYAARAALEAHMKGEQ